MDINPQANSFKSQDSKKQIQQKHDQMVSFKAELASKINTSSAVQAANETYKQSLMRAKRKKVSLQDTDVQDEDASVIKSI